MQAGRAHTRLVHSTPPPHPLIRTFIVEDSAVIRDSLIATLEELVPVLVVGTADNEADAVHWLHQPDNLAHLVIVDLFLRSGSGLGVLRASQAMDCPSRRVVLSNYATPDIRKKCLALGADQVFDKSHDIDALIHYCNTLAGNALGALVPGGGV